MALTRAFLYTFLVAILLGSSVACSKVGFHSPSDTNQDLAVDPDPVDPVDPPPPPPPPPPAVVEDLSYFQIFSQINYGGYFVKQSSDLKLEEGKCFFDNFYDFPDEIFEDDSLDNHTTTDSDLPTCRRLAIAEALKEDGGVCTAKEVTLSQAELDSIQLDSGTETLLSGLFPSLADLSVGDLENSDVKLQLDANCVCALTVVPPTDPTGTQVKMKIPVQLDLCTAKFPNRYSQTQLDAAIVTMKERYGID